MALIGAKAHSARLKRMTSPAALKVVDKAVFRGANIVAVEMANSITAGSVSGAGHVPSAPGEPPNADTRQLDTSIETQRTKPLHSRVVVDAPHAVSLELGTSKMAARPYAKPATRKKRAEVVEGVRKAVQTFNRQGAPS